MQTVLIVEDSPVLRQRLDEALGRVGYFTIQAETAQQALGVLRALHVDLLLTRERLSDVEGTELAAMARHRGLDELVVVVLADDPRAARQALDGGVVDAVLSRGADVGAVVGAARRQRRPHVNKSPPPAAATATCALSRA